eukprot:7775649-Pyramimonas_sp.AAC.1
MFCEGQGQFRDDSARLPILARSAFFSRALSVSGRIAHILSRRARARACARGTSQTTRCVGLSLRAHVPHHRAERERFFFDMNNSATCVVPTET